MSSRCSDAEQPGLHRPDPTLPLVTTRLRIEPALPIAELNAGVERPQGQGERSVQQ
jgi:hypothetical protein